MRETTLRTSWPVAALALGTLIVALLQTSTSAAPIAAGAGAIDRTVVVTETAANAYTPGGANPAPNTFVALPGAAITLDVPPNSSRLFVVQYTAESACSSGAGAGPQWCSVRILIGGVEGNPAAGADFAFDSADNGAESPSSWESHTVARSRRISNTGAAPIAVPIVVQRTTTSVATTLRLDDWHLTIHRHF
jgi:hypothetical protein